jgi:energy-coupling factor transport system ATP-binding protein
MIEFNNVSYMHASGLIAIRDVNLRIGKEEVVAIVGANGAGKTTLVRHVNGLLKPTKGNVTVFGTDTKKATIAELSRRIGIVFQNPNHQLFSDTVENEIAFGLRNFGFDDCTISKRLDWTLEFSDLKEYRHSSPLVLSGGEKKRLCLAMILSWDPEIIVLDEPTVGQDLLHKERLQQIIRMLISQGKTVIIVSHDIEFIWPMQPRILVMAAGRILADGTTADVFGNDNILADANLIRPQLLALSRMLRVKPDKPFANIHEAEKWILSHLEGG